MNNEIKLYILVDSGLRILYTDIYKEALERFLPIYPDSKIIMLKGDL